MKTSTRAQINMRMLEIEQILNTDYNSFRLGEALEELRAYFRRQSRTEGDLTFVRQIFRRWQIRRAFAERMIAAAHAARNLADMPVKPVAENQVRPLLKLEPKLQREAWATAIEAAAGNPTWKDVKAAAEGIRRPPTPVELLAAEFLNEVMPMLNDYFRKNFVAPRKQPDPEYVDIKEMKARFGISAALSYRLAREGYIKSASLVRAGNLSGRRLFQVESVRAYLNSLIHGSSYKTSKTRRRAECTLKSISNR